ncbi:MAG: hypothetical protein Q9184_004103 [Pyrenodesmia sp. 2 TL-2023]
MSSRGAPRGRGGGFGGGRGGGAPRGRGGYQQSYGPPAAVLGMGPLQSTILTAIGKVDEILGPINQVHFTIKPQEGIVATSFKSGDKFYIGGDKLLPLEKYVPENLSLFRPFAKSIPDSFPNLSHYQAQQSRNVQAEGQGEPQCAAVEEAEGVVAEGHQGDEVALEAIEAVEEEVVEEEEEASPLVAAAAGAGTQISQDLLEVFEAGAHNHAKGVAAPGFWSVRHGVRNVH